LPWAVNFCPIGAGKWYRMALFVEQHKAYYEPIRFARIMLICVCACAILSLNITLACPNGAKVDSPG